MAKIKVTQTRSSIARLPKHKATLKGLGLRHIRHTVELEDTPAVRGMINQVSYMVKVEENRMRLNSLSPAEGAKHSAKRLGRGIGSGLGKTGGRGHKGQKSRTGGGVRRGFEGGQMPLYRRLPKFGFTSLKSFHVAEIRLNDLAKVDGNEVTLETLKAANIITKDILSAKVILAGKIERAVVVKGLRVTKGAKAAIEAAGGSIEE
ncbi:hypothetical protein NDCJBJIB_01008 [Mannheimia haemolytica]